MRSARFRFLLLVLYALVFCAMAADWYAGAAGRSHDILVSLVVMGLTLEVGHVALTYFLLLGDPVLRRRFPWVSFLLLNGAVFFGLWHWKHELTTVYALYFLTFFDATRLYHNTRQGYGVAQLLAADTGAERGAGKDFDMFLYVVLLSGFAGIFSRGFLPPGTWYWANLISLAGPFLGFAVLVYRARRPGHSPFAALWLGRYTCINFGRITEIGPSFVRAVHGLEYYYIFFRFFRGRARALIATALAVAAALQLLWVLTQLHRIGVVRFPLFAVILPFLNTIIITHMAQDWWIFAHDPESRRRFREVAAAAPAAS